MFRRVAVGRARVLREIRAAAPLMTGLRAPIPARGPWLTAVLTASAAHRPVAVVIEAHPLGDPMGLALLDLRARGPMVTVALLGDSPVSPAPTGRPPVRLLAADAAAAGHLAAAVLDLLGDLRRPWTLRFAGLPLGCPTTAALAAGTPTGAFGSARTERLVDALDELGPVSRTTDPRPLDRALPALLRRAPSRRARTFLRAAARVHAAIGQLELAVVGDAAHPRAALLTLLDGEDRWPWWGYAPDGGLGHELGAPLVSFTATGGPRPSLQLPWTPWPAAAPGSSAGSGRPAGFS